jgi:surfeit locus 1 family protein
MTLLAIPAFLILILFGNWQWGRYQEKMAAQYAEPEWETLSGALLPETGRYVYAFVDGQSAWRGVFALDTGETVVFVPQTLVIEINPPEAPPASALTGSPRIALRGIWREPQARGAFTPPDQEGSGALYALDPEKLAATLSPSQAARVAARIFEPETLLRIEQDRVVPVLNPLIRAGLDERLPPERHFGYALTWWGLALALLGVYGVYHYQLGRLGLRGKDGA